MKILDIVFGSVISENWIARRSCLPLSSVNIIQKLLITCHAKVVVLKR